MFLLVQMQQTHVQKTGTSLPFSVFFTNLNVVIPSGEQRGKIGLDLFCQSVCVNSKG